MQKNAEVLVQLSQNHVLSLPCGRRLGFGKAVKHFRCGRSPGTSNGFSHDGHKVEALIDACAAGVAACGLLVTAWVAAPWVVQLVSGCAEAAASGIGAASGGALLAARADGAPRQCG